MKALIINNEVAGTFENVPRFLPEYGNIQRVDLRSSEELEKVGIKIVEYQEPDCNITLQKLEEPVFDIETSTVSVAVVDLQFDLDALLQRRFDEFELFEKKIRREITETFIEEIALATLPDTVKQFIAALQVRSAEVKAEIRSFYDDNNIERLVNYSFYTEETDQLKATLKALKANQ